LDIPPRIQSDYGSLSVAYQIEFDRVMDEIHRQLTHQPLVRTRNRKPLRPNARATWALRVGDLRVFYDVVDSERVRVLAVGRKRGNMVIIGGREMTS